MTRYLVRGRVRIALPLLLALCLSGCTYVCHTYITEHPLTAATGWRLFGYVLRAPGPSTSMPDRGSWRHWGTARDDVYSLVLTPVLDDSSLWNWVAVDAVDPVVRAPGYEQMLKWAKVVDVRMERSQLWGDPRPHWFFPPVTTLPRQEHGPRTFTSETFRLPYPPPDSLEIQVELQSRNVRSGAILNRITARAWAIIDRHRRWTIVDMIEA